MLNMCASQPGRYIENSNLGVFFIILFYSPLPLLLLLRDNLVIRPIPADGPYVNVVCLPIMKEFLHICVILVCSLKPFETKLGTGLIQNF